MPIYEYRCSNCGHTLEIMQKMNDPAPKRCPQCETEAPLERLVSRTSFQLKGGGWYSDLYGSTKPETSAKADASAASAPASRTETPAAPTAPAAASTPSSAPAVSSPPPKASGSGSGSGSTSS